jgi:hypothetical protein
MKSMLLGLKNLMPDFCHQGTKAQRSAKENKKHKNKQADYTS